MTRKGKLLALAAVVSIVIPILLGTRWFSGTWVPRHLAELDALARIDPAAAARASVAFVSWVLLVPVVVCMVTGIAWFLVAIRVVRAGRWPLPDAKVRRRTDVIGGWCARVPAGLLGLAMLAGLLCVWWMYVGMVASHWGAWLDRHGGLP